MAIIEVENLTKIYNVKKNFSSKKKKYWIIFHLLWKKEKYLVY